MKKLLLILSMILGLNTSTLMAELTQIQLHATMGIITNFILDDSTVYHHDIKYKPVTSPYTGRVWLDRNLGASQACTSFDDALCYGDYYQWGRNADGHQVISSSDTPTLANDVINVGHGDFITSGDDWTAVDSNGSLRAANWSAADGSSVCPVGFRVPTFADLKAEFIGSIDNIDVFNSFLKLPSGNIRQGFNGTLYLDNSFGAIWTIAVGQFSRQGFFYEEEDDARKIMLSRAHGIPVRCIKNTTPADIIPPVITITGGTAVSVLQNDSYSDAGATVVDNVDGNITVTSFGAVNTSIPGDYNITYLATDSAGNVATVVRTVTVLIVHNGTTYGTVTSIYTGKVWLDRNLGASQVCSSFDDALCYGDYYQWGRAYDGHQESNSSTTTILAVDVNNVGHGNFVITNSSPFDWTSVDSYGSLRITNWSAADGSSICPVGFRVPTLEELKTETLDNGVTNRDSAFSNFLKLPSAGVRNYDTGSVFGRGSWSDISVSSLSYINKPMHVHFSMSNAYSNYANHAQGHSIRCIAGGIAY